MSLQNKLKIIRNNKILESLLNQGYDLDEFIKKFNQLPLEVKADVTLSYPNDSVMTHKGNKGYTIHICHSYPFGVFYIYQLIDIDNPTEETNFIQDVYLNKELITTIPVD